MTEPTYELPPGLADAVRRHYGTDPDNPNDVHFLRDRIEAWRSGESGENIEARILDAVRGGDVKFLETLVQAAQPEPELRLTAADAALKAFFTLFIIECQCQGWPTKKQVREAAKRILQQGGNSIPSKRYWAQIFEQTGLSELPEAPSGRPKK